MKRLKKRAWESITLYHFTSSQFFMKMMEEGQITPGGYNDNISGGGHYPIYDLDDKNDGKEFSLSTIERKINLKLDEVTQRFKDYIEERKKENPDGWYVENVHVRIDMPSGDGNGVYLSNDQHDSNNYKKEAVNSNNVDKSIPNFGMILMIEVQTDALSPDYDDLAELDMELDKDSETPLWKQSLDKLDQCTHNGPISVDSIISVRLDSYNMNLGDKFSNEEDFMSFAENVTDINRMDTDISAEEAYNLLNNLNEGYKTFNQENLVASSNKSRLKKNS